MNLLYKFVSLINTQLGWGKWYMEQQGGVPEDDLDSVMGTFSRVPFFRFFFTLNTTDTGLSDTGISNIGNQSSDIGNQPSDIGISCTYLF